MMTHGQVKERRKAGIFFASGLIALFLSVFQWGALSLVLRVGGFVAIALSMRSAADPDHPTRRKIASIGVVLAFVGQFQNFFRRLALSAESPDSAFMQFYLVDHAIPALLLLAIALFPRASRRRSETALLWVAASLAAVFVVTGLGSAMMMQRTGDPTPQEYLGVVVLIRTVSFAPALAAAIMLLVPARRVVTEQEAIDLAARSQREAAVALKEAAAALEEASGEESIGSLPSSSQTPTAQPTVSGNSDLLSLLEGRLARGEISESTYLLLRDKYRS